MIRTGQIEELFHEARAFDSPEQQAAFLADACEDASIRARVEALLAAEREADLLFESAPGEALRRRPPALGERPGDVIGRYTLLELIGEGGFGSVFMAEQREPVRRLVALKILKLGMDTRSVVARFEQERQALALMDHSNIARVFDGGATDRGRPYFVMELVKGQPITEYCDERGLPITERLDLFMQVCHAVQHAHTKGVIHRDIKPGNVQVCAADEEDGESRGRSGGGGDRPVVKVIDFGIAKATSSRLTDKSFVTEFRQLVGTPEYMSPEQAEGSLDIDTRTDVYSLGVLLYELLTGHTPFEQQNLRSATYADVQRIIREVEPTRPSTLIHHDGENKGGVATRRRTEPRRLSQQLRGDLDWIVMKCLEKDRARRYDSASALARDIGCYLAHEPVSAGPPGRMYRLGKLVRRHRTLVAAAGAIAAALVIGLGVATIAMIDAQVQRDEKALALSAEAEQRAIAERSLRRAAAIQHFLLNRMIRAADPDVSAGRALTVREVMDLAAGNASLLGDAEVEAAVRHEIGTIYEAIELAREARTQLERALELRLKLGEDARADAAASMLALAHVLNLLESTAWGGRGEDLAREARAIFAELHGEDSLEVAGAEYVLAQILYSGGQNHKAAEINAAALERLARLESRGREGHAEGGSGESSLHADALALYAGHLARQGERDQATELLRRSLEIHERHDGRVSTRVATALLKLGQVLSEQQRLHEAEPLLKEALAIRRQLLPEDHGNIAQSLQVLGVLQYRLGRHDDAELMVRESLGIYQRMLGAQHEYVATTILTLAAMIAGRAERGPEGSRAGFVDAAALYSQAIEIYASRFGLDDSRLANALSQRGRVKVRLGLYKEAEADLLEAYRVLSTTGLLPDALHRTAERLVELYESWPRPENRSAEEAVYWRAMVAELEGREEGSDPGT